ncbi:unnamed protein product [Trifolium pratense]|uniref:Uncharacterized protein n=1 Tax=Trifolium pratense TaxID=57577 RepID=A0ACB0JW58_TRIPR|nr:unnamed protein product [Trifolium pratense]
MAEIYKFVYAIILFLSFFHVGMTVRCEPINKCESDADCTENAGMLYDIKCIDQKCEPVYVFYFPLYEMAD